VFYHRTHTRGDDLSVGEQKLNDFSVGEAQIGEKQSRQSNSQYNFMLLIESYVFIEKGIYAVYNGV